MNDTIEDYNNWRESQGLNKVPELIKGVTKRKIRNFSLSEAAYIGLKQLAIQHRYTNGLRGANITAFLEALGQGLIIDVDPTIETEYNSQETIEDFEQFKERGLSAE